MEKKSMNQILKMLQKKLKFLRERKEKTAKKEVI